MTQCCAKDKICIVQQPERDFLPNLVLTDFFLLLIIAQCYVYNDIQGGVEFSPLRNYRKLIKSKMTAISQGQTQIN